MRGELAFKPSGSRRTILLRLQPRVFQTFSQRDRLNALPGVESAAAAYCLPIQVEDGLPFQIIGCPLRSNRAHQLRSWFSRASPGLPCRSEHPLRSEHPRRSEHQSRGERVLTPRNTPVNTAMALALVLLLC